VTVLAMMPTAAVTGPSSNYLYSGQAVEAVHRGAVAYLELSCLHSWAFPHRPYVPRHHDTVDAQGPLG
jgi:hypothetical protein